MPLVELEFSMYGVKSWVGVGPEVIKLDAPQILASQGWNILRPALEAVVR
jgi:hypothetical protein